MSDEHSLEAVLLEKAALFVKVRELTQLQHENRGLLHECLDTNGAMQTEITGLIAIVDAKNEALNEMTLEADNLRNQLAGLKVSLTEQNEALNVVKVEMDASLKVANDREEALKVATIKNQENWKTSIDELGVQLAQAITQVQAVQAQATVQMEAVRTQSDAQVQAVRVQSEAWQQQAMQAMQAMQNMQNMQAMQAMQGNSQVLGDAQGAQWEPMYVHADVQAVQGQGDIPTDDDLDVAWLNEPEFTMMFDNIGTSSDDHMGLMLNDG